MSLVSLYYKSYDLSFSIYLQCFIYLFLRVVCCYLSALLLFQHSLGHWLNYFVAFSQLICLSSWENSLRKSIDKIISLLVGLFSLFHFLSLLCLSLPSIFVECILFDSVFLFLLSLLCHFFPYFLLLFCHWPSFSVPSFNYILPYFLSLSLSLYIATTHLLNFFYFFLFLSCLSLIFTFQLFFSVCLSKKNLFKPVPIHTYSNSVHYHIAYKHILPVVTMP